MHSHSKEDTIQIPSLSRAMEVLEIYNKQYWTLFEAKKKNLAQNKNNDLEAIKLFNPQKVITAKDARIRRQNTTAHEENIAEVKTQIKALADYIALLLKISKNINGKDYVKAAKLLAVTFYTIFNTTDGIVWGKLAYEQELVNQQKLASEQKTDYNKTTDHSYHSKEGEKYYQLAKAAMANNPHPRSVEHKESKSNQSPEELFEKAKEQYHLAAGNDYFNASVKIIECDYHLAKTLKQKLIAIQAAKDLRQYNDLVTFKDIPEANYSTSNQLMERISQLQELQAQGFNNDLKELSTLLRAYLTIREKEHSVSISQSWSKKFNAVSNLLEHLAGKKVLIEEEHLNVLLDERVRKIITPFKNNNNFPKDIRDALNQKELKEAQPWWSIFSSARAASTSIENYLPAIKNKNLKK